MNKKYEKLKQKIQAKLIFQKQKQIIVELRAMHLCLEEKMEDVIAAVDMRLGRVEKIVVSEII
jgi:hypothetical protein